jgi:hypothetical protein
MSSRKVVTVVCLGVALSVLVGWGSPSAQIKLNLTPKSETVYKVVNVSAKDYQFTQPSINKTKERHTSGTLEMVFKQRVESVDQQGNATVTITIKQLRYLSQGPEGVVADFNSQNEKDKSDPLMKLIGASYKIKLTPNGSVEVIDASAARAIIKEGSAGVVAARILSDEDIARRHQVMALFDADKCVSEKDMQKKIKAASSKKKSDSKPSKAVSSGPCKKGYQWSSLAVSPPGMLKPKTFEKVYTLTDLKKQNNQMIAVIDMNAVPSSKHTEELSPKDQQAMSFFSNMFDEKDSYSGKMTLNLTTGQIQGYNETLKVEWFAAENTEGQKSDKGPDQLTMGFTSIYSIEKID